jgi:hypothetical protein
MCKMKKTLATPIRSIIFLCISATALMISGTLNSEIIGHTPGSGGAGGGLIASPASVLEDVSEGGAANTLQQGFNEQQCVQLASDLSVDGGVILAGTILNSHMIFLNTDESGPGASDTGVVWEFDGPILGVMSDNQGALEVASSPFLGAVGTVYPGSPFPARGFESVDGYVVAGNMLTVSMTTMEPGDWIRVVTLADFDRDGICDGLDECPDSDLSGTITIDGCDTGVPNVLGEDGCTISDLIGTCADGVVNHGAFASCVAHLTNMLRDAGMITGAEKGATQSCAAQAEIP